MITMGRPGATEAVERAARRAGVDLDAGRFIMGPELPDISSSEAREALAKVMLQNVITNPTPSPNLTPNPTPNPTLGGSDPTRSPSPNPNPPSAQGDLTAAARCLHPSVLAWCHEAAVWSLTRGLPPPGQDASAPEGGGRSGHEAAVWSDAGRGRRGGRGGKSVRKGRGKGRRRDKGMARAGGDGKQTSEISVLMRARCRF